MTEPRTVALLAVATIAGLGGCVTKSTYVKVAERAFRLGKRFDACEKTRKQLDKRVRSLDAETRSTLKRLVLHRFKANKCAEQRAEEVKILSAAQKSLRHVSDTANELKAQVAIAKETSRALRARIAQMEGDTREKIAAAKRRPDLSAVEKILKVEIDAEPRLTMYWRARTLAFRVPNSFLFRKRSTRLLRRARALFARLADGLVRLSGLAYLIEGHAAPSEGEREQKRRRDRSIFRAMVVARALVRSGVPPETVTMVGLGGNRPPPSGLEPPIPPSRVEIVISETGAPSSAPSTANRPSAAPPTAPKEGPAPPVPEGGNNDSGGE